MRTMLLFKPCTVLWLFHIDRASDYRFGEDVPVEYAQKALALGRLDVVYASHLLIASLAIQTELQAPGSPEGAFRKTSQSAVRSSLHR
jgi:hypothetical protein